MKLETKAFMSRKKGKLCSSTKCESVTQTIVQKKPAKSPVNICPLWEKPNALFLLFKCPSAHD